MPLRLPFMVTMIISILFTTETLSEDHFTHPDPGAESNPILGTRQNGGGVPLIVRNGCGETIYPAIITQSGNGPGTGGFQLNPGDSRTLSVDKAWQGRVWGRTNCSFNGGGGGSGGPACSTGDCGSTLSCQGAVYEPKALYNGDDPIINSITGSKPGELSGVHTRH